MTDIFFFFRMLIYTAVFVFFLQVKIGPTTLEEKSIALIHTSAELVPLHQTAEGLLKVLRDGWSTVTSKFKHGMGEIFSADRRPGERKLFDLKRSEAHDKEQASRTDDSMTALESSDPETRESSLDESERVKALREELQRAGIIKSDPELQ